MESPPSILSTLKAFKGMLVVVLVPILASPLLWTEITSGGLELRCAYVVVVMGAFWTFEVMPLAVTALMPTFMFPLLGILSSKETCVNYLTHINFLFIGGLIVALAVEKSRLHERIALRVLTIVGAQPKWIMLGFMFTTAFLSMWMSNTATSAMMVPIAQSVIVQLLSHPNEYQRRLSIGRPRLSIVETEAAIEEVALVSVNKPDEIHHRRITLERRESIIDNETGEEVLPPPEVHVVEDGEVKSLVEAQTLHSNDANIAKAFMMSIAFAANIGGTGTITGTPPNLVLVQEFDKYVQLYFMSTCRKYPRASGLISFLIWMQFSVPLMIVAVIICWLCLVLLFMGVSHLADIGRRQKRHAADPAIERDIRNKYNALPKMSFAEIQVLVCFLVLLTMWIMRDPKVVPGFGAWFKHKYYTDATSAMIVSVILFVLPDKWPTRRGIQGTLMDWPTMQHKFPWSVVLLLGGGFALAAGVEKSGLSSLIGETLKSVESLGTFWLQLVCIVVTVLVTNMCSNTVTAVIFLQIVAEMANNVNAHPLLLMLPTVLACSYAFILPVATPPNAIVFATGLVTVADMMKAGALITVASVVLIMAHMQLWASLVFNLHQFPQWAEDHTGNNQTFTF